MPTACPHCLFEVEVAPGFGAATCPACNGIINEADVFPAEAAAAPAEVDMSLPPEEEMPADFLANASDFLGDPSAGAVAAEPAGETFSHDEMTLSLDRSSPADAANSVDATWAPDAGVAEGGGDFLASNSDFITGPGDPSASTEGDLALDVAAPAEPNGAASWDPGTVFPANDGNLAEAAWDSSSSAPPLLEDPVGVVGEAAPAAPEWDPNAAPPAEAPYDPNAEPAFAAPYDPNTAVAAEPAYDPNADPAFAASYDPTAAPETTAAAADEWAAPAESLGDPLSGGAIPEPFAAPEEEEDPYSGLPVNWEYSAPGLPTRPRMLPTVNEDGSPHEESHAGAGAEPAPAVADDAFFDTAPGPDPISAPPKVPAAVAPPPPPATASFVGAAPPRLPAPPPPSPRVQVELEAVPEPAPRPSSPSNLKPDAPGTPAPSFAPPRVASEFRAPERPMAPVERPASPTAPMAAAPTATPDAPWASTPAPPAHAARPAAIPGPQSRTPVYLGGAALALLVVAGGGFGLMKAFGGGEGLPVATPNPVAMLSATPAQVETETPADVEATPEPTPVTPVATPTAIGAKTPRPTPTPKVKLTPTPAPTKAAAKTPVPTPTKVAAASAPTATPRPAATPMPSTTKLAMTAATPKPVATPGSSFLDAAPVQSTVKSTAGSRFGANPNVDMRDARYKALEAGHKMLDAWKTDDASKQYKKIVKANDTFADGHYWYAYASALQGETERACKEFNRYLVLAPAGYYAKNARTQIKNCD